MLEKIKNQKESDALNKLKTVEYRIELLKRLKDNILLMEEEIYSALKLDLNKSRHESYMTEIGMALCEISYMIKHCKKFAKTKKVKTPLAQFPAKSYVVPNAYGQVLVIGPWNYPFQLIIEPMIDALSAGNIVVLKPSELAPNVQNVVEKLVEKTFTDGEVITAIGGVEETTVLLEREWDYIFFTGSTRVGKIVMRKAAESFTPITLELGGKSPCIVDETANVELSAKRIVFGKCLNSGQTCVAPDYVLCDKKIKDLLINELIRQIKLQYGENPLENQDYPKIINDFHFGRLTALIEKDKVIYGGKAEQKTLKIQPTLVNAKLDDEVMQEEIFGPILPIVEYENFDDAISYINAKNKPLALYLFSSSKQNVEKVKRGVDFGGGCINDTVIHLTSATLPFGGIKQSGLGAYHGKAGFDTFTHYKSIIDKKTWLDIPTRYHPVTKSKEKTLRKYFK